MAGSKSGGFGIMGVGALCLAAYFMTKAALPLLPDMEAGKELVDSLLPDKATVTAIFQKNVSPEFSERDAQSATPALEVPPAVTKKAAVKKKERAPLSMGFSKEAPTSQVSEKPASKPQSRHLEDDFPDHIEFISASAKGRNVVYTGANGEKVVKYRDDDTLASRSWVNNNPGNIEYGQYAIGKGAIGTDGRFAIFPSPVAGMEAHAALLRTETYRYLTLEQAIRRYAPSHENDTKAYIAYVEKHSGVDRHVKLSEVIAEGNLGKVVKAMSRQEGWKKGLTLVDMGTASKVATSRPSPFP